MTTLQKGEKTSFKGKYQKFQITLELNNAQVLGLEAFNSETKDVFSFALDKTYLLEHPQFFNLITEPKDILSYFIKNFKNVVFHGGKLIFPFSGPNCQKTEQINILLFKEPGLKAVYREIASQQQQIKKLQSINGSQDCLIADLTKSLNRLSSDIQGLKCRDSQIAQEISGLKFKDLSLFNDIQGLNKRFTPLQQSVGQLNIKNRQYAVLLSKLQQKDKQFDLNLSLLDQRQKKISDQLVQNDKKISASLLAVQNKYQDLCKLISTLKIKDGEIEKQIKQLMTQQEQDKKFQIWISDKLQELRKEIHDNSTRFNIQIKNLQAKDTSIEKKIDTQVTEIKYNFNQSLKNYEKVFLQKIQKNTKDIEKAQKDIAQLNVKFIKRDQRFQIQIKQFKEQEKRIAIELVKADNRLKILIQEVKEDYKNKFNYVRKQIEKLAIYTDNKFTSFNITVEKRFISIEKKNEELTFEGKKTNKAIEKANQNIETLRKQINEKDKKINEEIEKLNIIIRLNVGNIFDLINKLQEQSIKFRNQLVNLSFTINKQICQLQEKIKIEINSLDIYYKKINQFLQKLVFKDAEINKQIQDLNKREKSDTETTKKAIEEINKAIVKLQGKDADHSKKIGQLQAKDKEIVCRVESQVSRLDQSLKTTFQAAQNNIKAISSELSKIQAKLAAEIKGLHEQDCQILNSINNNVESLKQLICEKASNEYVMAQVGKLNNRIAIVLKSLSQQAASRDANDLQIKKTIQTNYIQLLQKISAKADTISTVSNKQFQRAIKELWESDYSIQKQIGTFVNGVDYEITEIKKYIKQNDTFIKNISQKITFKYINTLLWEPKLGNHPLNQNSNQIISTKRLADNILSVSKPQTNLGAYNFVNIYQIEPYSIVRYTVKIIKCDLDIIGCFSFSDEICLNTEYYTNMAQSLSCKTKVVNSKGRNGIKISVNSGDQIQCIANLFQNQVTFTQAKNRKVQKFSIDGNLRGKSLFFQVASEESIDFQIII